MNTAQPLKINNDPTLSFLFLFSNAQHLYVLARQALLIGWTAAGCFLAQQSIELFIKAIIKLNYKKYKSHNLINLLEHHRHESSYFDELLGNPQLTVFLKELSNG